MTNGYLIPTDGNVTKHQQQKMSEIGAVIGSQTGLFDLVYGEIDGKIFLIWVDDTGLIDGRPINPLASMIAGRPLFGDVFVSGDENEEGVVQDLEFEAFDVWFSNRLLMALTSSE